MNIFLLIALVASLLANWYLARCVAFLERRAEVGRTLRNSVNECNKRVVSHWDEAREEALQLRKRVKQLKRALAECVAALRAIEMNMLGYTWSDHAYQRKEIARAALQRIQIPDDELPTEGYPTDGT